MNIRQCRGNQISQIRVSPTSCPLRKRFFLPWGCACPRPTGAALAQPRNSRAMPIPVYLRRRREKVFGPGRAVPLDRNAKARILAYAKAWSARHRQPRQHRGPITRTFLEVLEAMLWGFHNSRTGCCFPPYEAIAVSAECNRDTVYEALKVLEWAGVLTWQNRIARIQVRERDLFGRWANRWR